MQRWLFGIILGLAVLAGAWRFFDLGRDPDIVTQSSQDAWGDPAQYLYNARSHVLFGEWRPSEGTTMYAAPGYTFLAAICLSLFGVVYSHTVVMAVLAGFVVIAATAMYAGTAVRFDRDVSPAYAIAASAVMLLGSYIIFANQRVPNGDMEALATSSLAALCLAGLQSVRLRVGSFKFCGLAVLGGLGIGLAPFVKVNNAIFAIAAVVAWLTSYFVLDADWKTRWRAAMPWLAAGVGFAICIWLAWAVWMYRISPVGVLAAQMDRLRIYSVLTARPEDKNYNPRGTFSLLRFFQSNLMYRQPIEAVLAPLGFFSFFFGKRKNWAMFLASIWWLTGVAVMTNITPDPLRYRLIVWPAAIVLAAHSWSRLANGLRDQWTRRAQLLTALGLGIVFGAILVYFASIRLNRPISLSLQWMAFIVTIAVAYLMVRALAVLPPKPTALILALAFVVLSVPQWVAGERQVTHELAEAARRLDKYPADYVLGGGWGVFLGFSSHRNAYFFWTPESTPRVDLFVEDPLYLKDIPLPWHEVERHKVRRLPLEIAFVRIDR